MGWGIWSYGVTVRRRCGVRGEWREGSFFATFFRWDCGCDWLDGCLGITKEIDSTRQCNCRV